MYRPHCPFAPTAGLMVTLWTSAAILSAGESSSPVFSEDTRTLGIDFVHWNGMSGELYMPETVGSGAALFDYDGDGDLDVYLVQGALLGPGKTFGDALVAPRHPRPLGDRLYRNDLAATDGGRRGRSLR